MKFTFIFNWRTRRSHIYSVLQRFEFYVLPFDYIRHISFVKHREGEMKRKSGENEHFINDVRHKLTSDSKALRFSPSSACAPEALSEIEQKNVYINKSELQIRFVYDAIWRALFSLLFYILPLVHIAEHYQTCINLIDFSPILPFAVAMLLLTTQWIF